MVFTSFFNQLLQLPCSLMGVCKFVVDDWGRVLQEALLAVLKNKLGVELNFHQIKSTLYMEFGKQLVTITPAVKTEQN